MRIITPKLRISLTYCRVLSLHVWFKMISRCCNFLKLIWVPVTVMALIVCFAALIWLGRAGLDTVVSETHEIVGRNLDSAVRISEIASRLQKISAHLNGLMTLRAAGTEGVDVPREISKIVKDVSELRVDLSDYRDHLASPQQVLGINDALNTLENYEGAVRWVGSMLELDFAAAVAFIHPFNKLFDSTARQFEEITSTAVIDARLRATVAAESANGTVLKFIILTLIVAVAISVGAWMGGRQQHKLQMTTEVLERLVTKRTHELAQRTADLEESLVRLRETQASLVMQEKMASLGGLVAGVAHEINTPIGVALTCVTFLSDETEKIQAAHSDGKLRKADFAEFIENSTSMTRLLQLNIERAASLVATFKMVSADRTSEERRIFNLMQYIDKILTSLSPSYRTIGHTVTLDCPNDIVIDGYPGAFAQILSNFVMNSIAHGFDDGASGNLTVQVTKYDVNDVELIYEDDGRGVPPEHRARIFDPFFTTRRGSSCTGLGLHIVFNLVHARLGGSVQICESDGGGARFILRFPLKAPE